MNGRPTARRRLVGSAAALLVGVVTGLGLLAPTPAQAAGCSGVDGVTVVVDFAELGGGLTAGCDGETDGQRARAILADAGYTLTMATKSPGFVCRVNGLPAEDPCVEAAPADRYWSVWWADGEGGSWVYSSRGVDSLRVPDGGYLALAWHQGDGKGQPPSTVPVVRSAPVTQEPVPTSRPAPQGGEQQKKSSPGQSGDRAGGGDAPATTTPPGSEAPTPTATPSVPSGASAPEDGPTPGETFDVDPTLPDADEITLGPEDATPTAAESPEGLPGWVVPVVLIVLVTVGALVVVRRRAV